MNTIKKRISAVLLSVYMVFGVVSTDYLTVQAFEWVVPSLTVGDSILWLMGLLGIAYTEGASAWRDVSPEYEQEFVDYANEHGLTYNQTSTWLNDVAGGKLNQLSEVWTNFKEWVKSLVPSSSLSGQYEGSLRGLISSVYTGNITSIGGVNLDNTITSGFAYYSVNSLGNISDMRIITNCVIDSVALTSSGLSISLSFNNSHCYSLDVSNGRVSDLGSGGLYSPYTWSFSASTSLHYLVYNSALDYSSFVNGVYPWGGSQTSDSEFDAYNPALIPDINFAGANTEDASIPGVIDLPWGNLGDDEEERDKTYDDLVGGLDLGKEIGDLWQALQDLMGVLAVDDAGVLQPNSGGENPPTLEDEAEKNKVNGAFVLIGLQKVFPFCIPFDLYAFITLLEAPPVAPVIQYPIYNPVTKSNEIITIDFSTWESVVVLFRYIFDFLFIIGLLLLARALIGGGDSA